MQRNLLLTTAVLLGFAAPIGVWAQQSQPQPPSQTQQQSGQQSQQLQQAIQQLRDAERQLQQAKSQQGGQQDQQKLQQARQQAQQALQQIRQAALQQGDQDQQFVQNLDRADQALRNEDPKAVDVLALVIADVDRMSMAAAGPARGAEIQVQQPAPEIAVQQPPPQVTVQQPPPQVTVQQPQPEVTVQQARPEVTVEQPRPEVTVQQARPEVTVEQARPDVTVQRSGEPQVEVKRAGQPEVAVQQEARPEGQNQPQMATRTDAGVQAENLLGKTVLGSDGQELGEIEDIILNPQTNQAQKVVIASGGFLGLGEKKIAMDFERLQIDGDRVVAPDLTQASVEGLEQFEYDDNTVSLTRNRADGQMSPTEAPRQ